MLIWSIYIINFMIIPLSKKSIAGRISPPPAVQSEPSIRRAIYRVESNVALDYNTFKEVAYRLSDELCFVSFLLNLLKRTFNYVSIQTNFAFASFDADSHGRE